MSSLKKSVYLIIVSITIIIKNVKKLVLVVGLGGEDYGPNWIILYLIAVFCSFI